MDQATVDRLRESYSQLLGLSGILAGFSFTVVMQLLTNTRRRLVSLVLAVYLTATALFLAAAVIGTLALGWLRPDTSWSETQFTSGLGVVGLSTGGGILLFLLGLSIAGFLYSRRVGVIAIMAALLALLVVACGIFYILVDYRTL